MVKNNRTGNHSFLLFCFPTFLPLGKRLANFYAIIPLIISFYLPIVSPLNRPVYRVFIDFSGFSLTLNSDPDGVWHCVEWQIVGGLVGKRGE
jgi:hypothetical protein